MNLHLVVVAANEGERPVGPIAIQITDLVEHVVRVSRGGLSCGELAVNHHQRMIEIGNR